MFLENLPLSVVEFNNENIKMRIRLLESVSHEQLLRTFLLALFFPFLKYNVIKYAVNVYCVKYCNKHDDGSDVVLLL